MAPIAIRSALPRPVPTLHDFIVTSPHLFWGVLGICLFAFMLLLGWASLRVFRHLCGANRDALELPLHNGKETLRPLLLPRLFFPDDVPTTRTLYHRYLHDLRRKDGLVRPTRMPLAYTKPKPATWLSGVLSQPPIAPQRALGPAPEECMSPVSKAWAEGHERLWAEEAKRMRSGTLRPIPWVLYVPKHTIGSELEGLDEKIDLTASTFGSVAIAFPELAVLKGEVPAAIPPPSKMEPPGTSPPEPPSLPHLPSPLVLASSKVSEVPALEAIAEDDEPDELDEPPTFEAAPESALSSHLSEDSLYSQPSADFSVLDLGAIFLPAPESISDVPAIVINECPDAPLPSTNTLEDALAALTASLGGTFLHVPDPDAEPPAPRPLLGAVNRSNVIGGRVRLTAAPARKRELSVAVAQRRAATGGKGEQVDYKGKSVQIFSRMMRGKENAAASKPQ